MSHPNSANILKFLGHVIDRDFTVYSDGATTSIQWLAATPKPTDAAIDAAAASAQAAEAARDSLLAEIGVDKSTLAAAYQTMHDRLVQIENAVSPNNAQLIQAVRDIATYEKRILRAIRAILT